MSDRVVLLGVDGLDWGRLREGTARGELPNLARLLEEGAWAEVAVRSSVPGLPGPRGPECGMPSPVLWTTIASGQYYFQHGIFGFSNPLESLDNPPLFHSGHVRSPRVWDVLSQRRLRSLVVGYYVTHPAYAIDGVMVSDLFGETAGQDVVWPAGAADLLARKLGAKGYAEYFRAREIFGGGSSADEAAALSPESRAAIEQVICRFADPDPEELVELFEKPEGLRRRRLIEFRLVYPAVRDEHFHRLLLSLIDEQEWQFATGYYRLLDFLSHGFWETGHEFSADYLRQYGQVVRRGYQWIDRCVGEVRGRLRSGDRLLVLSDHGFKRSAEVAKLADCHDVSAFCYSEHAEPAVLLASGGPRRGEIPGVSLLDIAPSILDFFGVPMAETLDGGPVPGLLRSEVGRADSVPRYEFEGPGRAAQVSSAEESAIVRRLAALGYMEEAQA